MIVTGTVPDVRPYLQHAAVVVAPLRVARGIQNKILEAMAMARPVVVSSAAASGVTAVPGVDFEIAANAEEFCRKIAGGNPRRKLAGRWGNVHVPGSSPTIAGSVILSAFGEIARARHMPAQQSQRIGLRMHADTQPDTHTAHSLVPKSRIVITLLFALITVSVLMRSVADNPVDDRHVATVFRLWPLLPRDTRRPMDGMA